MKAVFDVYFEKKVHSDGNTRVEQASIQLSSDKKLFEQNVRNKDVVYFDELTNNSYVKELIRTAFSLICFREHNEMNYYKPAFLIRRRDIEYSNMGGN